MLMPCSPESIFFEDIPPRVSLRTSELDSEPDRLVILEKNLCLSGFVANKSHPTKKAHRLESVLFPIKLWREGS